MTDSIARWVAGTTLSWAVHTYPWIWPTCETLHFIGMALLVGIVGLFDLRMMGLVRGLPIEPVRRLLPWGVLGFVINLVTGVVFFIGSPFQYVHNLAFQLKLLFIVVAGINLLIFHRTGLSDKVDAVSAEEEVPLPAKAVAALSLFLWIGVIYWGRMLPWIGSAGVNLPRPR